MMSLHASSASLIGVVALAPGQQDAGRDGTPAVRCPLICGPNAYGDCCESLYVPGGTFYRDSDVAGDGKWNDMTHPSTNTR